jgi:TRAP transporter TAXI family solute receptor
MLLLAAGCDAPPSTAAQAHSAPPREVRFLTGPSTGAYSPLGAALAAVYNRQLPGLHVVAEAANGPQGAGANAPALEAGQADLAFSRADIAFQTFRQTIDGESSASHLRSIAVVYPNAVHVVVRRDSGITRGEEMRGTRVQVSDDSVAASPIARLVLEAYGLSLDDVRIDGNPRNAVSRLKAGELDVRIFASAYPLASLEGVGDGSGIRLLSLPPDVIERLREKFSFFKPAVIPKGTYLGQDADVQTVSIDGLLMCRDTMPEEIVYNLTRTLFEAIPELSRTLGTARLINASNAPATPVPLHPGAARYYRERDLFR